jgi:transcriptional regulator with XRE-family HTH domain
MRQTNLGGYVLFFGHLRDAGRVPVFAGGVPTGHVDDAILGFSTKVEESHMKQIIPDGPRIKTLRLGLESNATQKELAYAVRVSERKLRQIENESAPISVATMELLAKNLGVHREQITVRQSALQLVAADGETVFDTILSDLRKDRLVPRFDYDLANVTMDEGVLFKEASHVHDFVCEIMVPLNEETGEYAEELIAILTSLTWSERSSLDRPTSVEEIALRRRIRQLMVLLRGNDIWIYHTHLFRKLPERHTLPPEDEPSEMRSRFIIALAPPGEYGETCVRVPVDHGQPFVLKGW